MARLVIAVNEPFASHTASRGQPSRNTKYFACSFLHFLKDDHKNVKEPILQETGLVLSDMCGCSSSRV